MAKEYFIPAVPLTMGWKFSFNLAMLFHLLLLSSAIVLPKYLSTRTELPDFTTVNLVNIAEMLPPAPPAPEVPPQKPLPPVPASPKPEAAKTAPILDPVPPPAEAAPAKAISIKPLKRKIKKKIPPGRSTEEIEQKKALAKQQELERRSRELQEEARRQQALADAEAQRAKDALTALRKSLEAEAAASSQRAPRAASGTGSTSSALEAQYYSTIFSHLQRFWDLPAIKQWDPQLTATVVITIGRNGRIMQHRIEKRSGDRLFDQYVSRTIREANPFPQIPAALKESEYSIGLRFSPKNIK